MNLEEFLARKREDDIAARDALIGATLRQGEGTNPDQYAKTLQLSREANLPVDVVERNQKEIELQRRQRAWADLSKSSPALAANLADPSFVKVVGDDGFSLKTFNDAMDSFLIGRKPVTERNQQPAGVVTPAGFDKVVRRIAEENPVLGFDNARRLAAQTVTVSPKGTDEPYAPTTTFGGAVNAFRSGLTSGLRAQDLQNIIESQEILAAAAMADAGDERLKQSKYASLFAGAAGSPTAVSQIRARAEATFAENVVDYVRRTGELRNIPQLASFAAFQKAEGVSDTLGAFAAAKGGVDVAVPLIAQSLGQLLPTSPLMVGGGAVGGVRGLMAGTGASSFVTGFTADISSFFDEKKIDATDPRAVQAAASSPEFQEHARKAFIKNAVIGTVDAATAGVAGGVRLAKGAGKNLAAQTGVQMAGGGGGEALGSILSGQDVSFNAVFSEMIAEVPGAAFDAAVLHLNDAHRAMVNGATTADYVKELVNQAAANKVLERDTETFEKFTQSIIGDENDKLHISADALQQSGVLNQLDAAAPDLADKWRAAVVANADIEIPVAEFLGRLTKAGIAQKLVDHVRLPDEQFSKAEAEQYAKEHGPELLAKIEKAVLENATQIEQKADYDFVRKSIAEQIKATGRYTDRAANDMAVADTSFFATVAKRAGMTLKEFYEKYPRIVTDRAVRTAEKAQALRSASDRTKGTFLNIGLNIPDEQGGGTLDVNQVLAALDRIGVVVERAEQVQSDTELTYVPKLSRPLTPEELDALAIELKQEAIPQLVNGVGDMRGPKAAEWGPFSPEFFYMPDGRRMTESQAMDQSTKLAGLARIEKHLTPKERAKLNAGTAAALIDRFKGLPPVDEFAAVAWAGRAKRGWYRGSAKAIAQVFGPDAPRFTALLAAMSPQNSVETNLENALHTWKNWLAAGRPQTREEIVAIMGRSVQGKKGEASVLDAWINNSVRALTSEEPGVELLSGPKVDSFMRNLLGDVYEVTNDAWMANFAFVDQRMFKGTLNLTDAGKGPGYLAMAAKVRAAAARLTELTGDTWTPAEVQETVWSWAKTLYEAQGEGVMATDILYNGDLTDDMIRSTPDFRGLFHDQKYESILAEAGYSAQLAGLDNGDADQEGAATGGETAPFDDTAQSRHEFAAAKRLEQLRIFGKPGLVPDGTLDQRTEQAGDGSGRQEGGKFAPLEGAPAVEGGGPIPELVQIAERYARDHGIDLRRQSHYVEVDPDLGRRIAEAYAAMEHAPNDPRVRASYDALIEQTRAQYDALVAAGYKFTFFDSKNDPYKGNPWAAMRDLRATKTMAVYGTYDGYGNEVTGFDTDVNLLVVPTGLQWPDQAGVMHDVTANDLFRAVHDAFGHGLEGAGFRARGEANAFEAHARLFTPEAHMALANETRAQNSWLNFNPRPLRELVGDERAKELHPDNWETISVGEHNQTASVEDTIFADQKNGVLPEWVWTEGRAGDRSETLDQGGWQLIDDDLPTRESAENIIRMRTVGNSRVRPSEMWAGYDLRVVDSDNPGFFAIEARKKSTALDQPGDQPKGQFHVPTRTISLLDSADLSTFHHEAAHSYLEILIDLANQPEATEDIKNIAASVLKWFGITGTEDVGKGGDGGALLQVAGFKSDIPNREWLQGKIDYAVSKGRDQYGAPYFGTVTGRFTKDQRIPVSELAKLRGLKGEQDNVRQEDLAAIKKIMEETGKLPLMEDGREYAPFIMVAHNGEAWVSEGNHRIMAAAALGWESLPVEIRYFDGGELKATGAFSPSNIAGGSTLLQVGSDAFKRWFGDSKVVDKNGAPLVVYHGTGAVEGNAFSKFRTTGNGLFGKGAYFSESAEDAADYAHGREVIYPVYLAITRPYVVMSRDGWAQMYEDVLGKAPRNPDNEFPSSSQANAIRDALLEMGHDGIKVLNEGGPPYYGASHWIAFRPEQIKSVFNKNPTNDPNILNQSPWYSALQRAIESSPTKAAPAQGWKDAVKGWVSKGLVKQDEVDAVGLIEYLDTLPGKITRDQVFAFIEQNGVQVEEVTLGEDRGGEDLQVVEGEDGTFEIIDTETGATYRSGYATWEEADADIKNQRSDGAAKFSNPKHRPPGGDPTTYREMLFTLPPAKPARRTDLTIREGRDLVFVDSVNTGNVGSIGQNADGSWGVTALANILVPYERKSYPTKEAAIEAVMVDPTPPKGFRSTHWDQPNVLAHTRLIDSTDAEGNRVLNVIEIQSDWGQKGRDEGFKVKGGTLTPAENARLTDLALMDPAAMTEDENKELMRLMAKMPLSESEVIANKEKVPSAPFVTKTDAWVALVLKRVVKLAVDEGYDKVAISTGQEAADMFDLSKQVDRIHVDTWEDGTKSVNINLVGGGIETTLATDAKGVVTDGSNKEFIGKPLDAVVGKEMAEKIMAVERKTFSGLDLKVGGEGMKAFYDKIVPSVLKDVLKKVGGKVETVEVVVPDRDRGAVSGVDVMSWLGVPLGEMNAYWRDHAYEHDRLFERYRNRKIKEGGQTRLGFTVTDEMRKRVEGGMPLFQGPEGQEPPPMAPKGRTPLETWNLMTLEEKRPYHEKFARGYELFLFEGKAPSVELRTVFQRFREWMIGVYKTMTHPDFQGVKLNDEIRSVYSRLLASDEQIAEAQATSMLGLMFSNREQAEAAGLNWDEYQRLTDRQRQDALDELQVKSLRELKWLDNARSKTLRALQREAAAARREVRMTVRRELMAQPIYQAWVFLSATGEDTGKLRAVETIEAAGPAVVKQLREYGMIDADGLMPDLVADRFGFESGAQLATMLADTTPLEQAIREETDRRMLADHSELATPEALARAVDDALHNKHRTKMAAMELTALEKMSGTGRRAATSAKLALEFARNQVRNTLVRNLNPGQAKVAEARAARDSLREFKKGNIPEAARHKRNEVVHSAVVRAINEAKDQVQKTLDYFKKIDTPGARKSRRGEYLAQRDALLARFDLRQSTSLKKIDAERQALAEWVKAESERLSAIMPELPDWILNEGYRKSYKDMTVEELAGLKSAVEQLDKMARRENEQYLAIRKQTFTAERDALLARLRQTHPEAFDKNGEPTGVEVDLVPSLASKFGDLGDKFLAEMVGMEHIVLALDGGKIGPVWESLFGRLSRAHDWKAERLGQLFKDLRPLLHDQYSELERIQFSRKDIGTPAGLPPLTRENALVVALLNGNAEGRQRLTNYGWGSDTVQRIVDLLDARDVALANAVWRMFDHDLWPELKALNERTKGTSPPKVQAVPSTAKAGELTGGYFPIKYDADLDERTHRRNEASSLADMLGGDALGMSAKPRSSASNERKETVAKRPLLSLSVLSNVANETVHDIAYREAVADTMRLLNDSKVTEALKVGAGIRVYRMMVDKVRGIAAPPIEPSSMLDRTLAAARKNTVVTLLSGAMTALQNITGLAPAMVKAGPGVLTEAGKFFSPLMVERTRFVLERSAYMRGLTQHYEREVQTAVRNLTVNGRIMPDTSSMLFLMGWVNMAVAVPTWNAAFKAGMEMHDNDVARATDHADSVVRQTQGSGRKIDLAQVADGGELRKVFTMFYSYFSGQLSLLVQTGAVSRQLARENPAKATLLFTTTFFMVFAVPAVLNELMKNGLEGDDEDQAKRWAKVFASYAAAMFPIVRDIYAFAIAKFDPDAKFHASSFRLSPVEAAFEGAIKGVQSGYELATGDGDIKDVRGAIMGAGFILGLPGKLISDIVTGTNAWLQGEAGPQAILFGPPRK